MNLTRRPQGANTDLTDRRMVRLIVVSLLAGLAIIAATWVTAAVTGDPVGTFTRDVSVLWEESGTPVPRYAGAVSLLNLMLWAAIGALSLFVAWLVPQRRVWLMAFAGLNLLMAADDALLLHERIGPFHRVPEMAFYVFYGAVAAVLTWGILGRRMNPATVPFLVGCALLAMSALIDKATSEQYLLEDGVKLLGAFVWLTVPLLCLPAASRDQIRRSS